MSEFAKKVVLNSTSGYSPQHDNLLADMIDQQVLLFCAVGKDCELWHDVMDEIFVGDGTSERDFHMMTTWHTDESLEEVCEFAKFFHVETSDNDTVQIVTI